MDSEGARAILWIGMLAVIAVIVYAATSGMGGVRRGGPGPGASGAVYDLLNEEKRKAIEIIVEQRAEARDPEDKDGDLPQLEDPKAPRR
jgi:hypothetical protein